MKTTVLFCQSNSIYNKIGCDTWDEKRDALNYIGHTANIYHPPCRLWSRMHHFSNADESEKYLALWAVNKVRSFGGILEHPQASRLFKLMNLPKPGNTDDFGFTIEIDQFNFGHKAQKKTWLYIVGISPDHFLLNYKKIPAKCKYVVSTSKSNTNKIEIQKHERSATPIRFAKFLVKICKEINNLKSIKEPPTSK